MGASLVEAPLRCLSAGRRRSRRNPVLL